MQLKVLVLAGDGIGPEVTEQAIRVLRTVAAHGDHAFTFEDGLIGGAAIDAAGTPFPPATREAALASDAVFLGAVGHNKFNALPPSERPEAGLLALRAALGGFANLRPAFAHPALADNSPLRPAVIEEVDILFVRELLGGLYFGQPREWNRATNEAWNTMRYTRAEIERVARVAFELAGKRRKKLTSVDKANVLEVSQLWRATVNEVAKDYPEITVEHEFVDACSMHLMNNPRRFDVILTENLFGDILSDEAGVITGSLGVLPSATIGGQVDLFEPVHGSAPDIAGQGIANPVGAILTAAMLLRHSAKLEAEALAVEQAVRTVLESGARTKDLARGQQGTILSTQEMGTRVNDALIDVLRGQAESARLTGVTR
ncbi:3-isopropylmalate dehydrogenase [Acidipila sp. EB88]|uniref:3-isopropylmalate dehydrogenase n=1 Tax=Acidipila sp. EB88 TaxID=2305226 RepID=UPI000F5F7863|nr:3-isopropylmalate dehydrogenase [Acidipila sp. EB88]RRA48853.1 3-isopropylmalate dehydrogenase [Acidipila sp. EB88]